KRTQVAMSGLLCEPLQHSVASSTQTPRRGRRIDRCGYRQAPRTAVSTADAGSGGGEPTSGGLNRSVIAQAQLQHCGGMEMSSREDATLRPATSGSELKLGELRVKPAL